MPFAFAPHNLIVLAVLGLSAFLYLIMQQPKHAFKLGWAFGFGWFGFGGWWLADTFQTYGHLPYIVGLFVVVLFGLIMGSFLAFWAWFAVKLRQKDYELFWIFPLVGVLEEWLRSFLFTGLPWAALGNLLLETPASSWISIFGNYGATLILLLAVSSLVFLVTTKHRKLATLGLTICLLALIFSPRIEVPNKPTHQAALIQPNTAQDQKWDAAFAQNIMFGLAKLSAQAGDVDIIVWPEAAVPMYLSHAPNWNAWLTKQINTWHAPVIFGGIKLIDNHNRTPKKSQSVLFLAQQGETARPFVGKHHLVPFGEYVPAWMPWLSKLVPDIGDFEQATDNGILTVGEQKFGSLICYESIFSDEAAARVEQGANVIIVATNDAWYGKSPATWQHTQAAQVRAIETGRYVLRAANTGISAIISPDGKIQKSMPWWQDGIVLGRYQPLTHITLYQQWGNIPVLILVFLGLGFGLVQRYRGKR